MLAFLDAFHALNWHGFKRDWFNQRAFNKPRTRNPQFADWSKRGQVKCLDLLKCLSFPLSSLLDIFLLFVIFPWSLNCMGGAGSLGVGCPCLIPD